jgi:anti-sigma28 factor (negative regulator of flagellin synthesis)
VPAEIPRPRPASPPVSGKTAAVEAGTQRREGSLPRGKAPHDVPRPIGKERLKALREAIRNGTYPSDEDVAGGLARMFGRPGEGRRRGS